jgi:hypothetical protein
MVEVFKLGQVAGQVFLAHPMMDATDVAFDVGDQGMHPGEHLHGLGARTGHEPLMLAGRAVQDTVALQPSVRTTTAGPHLLGQRDRCSERFIPLEGQ